MIQRGSIIKGYHAYANFLHVRWRQIFEKLRRMKFFRIDISYDCVVIEGYPTRTKKSYGKLSFHYSAIGSWLIIYLFESKDRIVLVITEPGFPRCTQSDTDLAIWYQIVSVS